jgi:hypothetical protein
MVDALRSPAGFLSVIGIAFGPALLARGMVGQPKEGDPLGDVGSGGPDPPDY